MAEPPRRRRYTQLDSLRGLAALSVVFSHFLRVSPEGSDQTWWWWLLTRTPLAALQSGHEAVLLFFVLSGFVLSLPYWRGPVEPRGFYARRICRIGIPHWAALAVACGLILGCARGPIPALGAWFNGRWTGPPEAATVLQHILLIGIFIPGVYNPALWSLVVEMRISLVYPLLIATFGRWSPGWALVGAALLTVVGTGVRLVTQNPLLLAVGFTVRFTFPFVLGIIVARHHEALVAGCQGLSRRVRVLLLLLAGLLYSYPHALLPEVRWLHLGCVNEGLVALGSALLIVLALTPGRFSTWLLQQPWTFLGRISYSLYLYHGILLLALCHLLYGHLPLGGILVLTLVLSVPVAALSYRWVEEPAIACGRALTRRFAPAA